MEFVTEGCPIPDLVIAEVCVVSSYPIPIAIAVIAAFLGLFRLLFGQRVDPKEAAKHEFALDQLTRTLRSLIAVAAADGRLEKAEIDAIRYVGAEHFGLDFPEDMIREMYAKMGSKIDVQAEIEGNFGRSLTEPSAIQALISGMIVVSAADGDFSSEERALLTKICAALKLDEELVQQVMSGADELAARYKASQGAAPA